MHRLDLLNSLRTYEDTWITTAPSYHGVENRLASERETLTVVRNFIEAQPDCFKRSLSIGHVTGSALVVDPTSSRVLLTLHKKLGKWLQLGGHCDGESQVHLAALREAEEESGLAQLSFTTLDSAPSKIPLPFDIDAHTIPANAKEAAHVHYDVRYLLFTSAPESWRISDESADLRWFPLAEAKTLTGEESMQRQFDKLAFLLERRTLKPYSAS